MSHARLHDRSRLNEGHVSRVRDFFQFKFGVPPVKTIFQELFFYGDMSPVVTCRHQARSTLRAPFRMAVPPVLSGTSGLLVLTPTPTLVVPYYAAGRDPSWSLADGPPNCSYTVVGIRCGSIILLVA